MNFVDLIIKKRDGNTLSTEEINFFINGVTNKTIPDYQISAMLMAIYLKGLDKRETADLTMAMTHSGSVLDLSSIEGVKVDKHSTGGVGDTTTLILAPLTASLGLPVVKMSGRGLGHTGGTLDKLESIPGFNVNVNMDKAIEQVNNNHIVIMGQTADLAPADKFLYALRDVTGTVESLPLIASSIMSKKLAGGADAIVLDVKCGKGAFMKNINDARALANEMIELGKSLNKKVTALITNMDEPLGMNIGNSLEVIEAIEVLKGQRQGPLKDVSIALGAEMLVLGGIAKTTDEAKAMLEENIANFKGLFKFAELISLQGGIPAVIKNYSLFPQRMYKTVLISQEAGYISDIDALLVGHAASETGAGRKTKADQIDYGSGIMLKKSVGDKVDKGEIIAKIFAANDEMCQNAKAILNKAVKISQQKPENTTLIYEIIK